MQYSEQKARQVLDGVRRGSTLTTLCQKPGYPSREEVYDWLRSSARLDGRLFRTAYMEAEEDRRRTWRDMAILEITRFKETGEDDNWRLNLAKQKAAMLMNASKEPGIAYAIEKAVPEEAGTTVIIKQFGEAP